MSKSWHHCACNITWFDAIPDISFTLRTTVPAMELTLIKYRLLALQLAPLHPQQQYIWCSTGYFSYRWHQCTHKITGSDSVPVTCHAVGITVPTTALTQIQYQLLPLLLAPLYLQQHQLWCSTAACQQISSSSTNTLQSLVLLSQLQTKSPLLLFTKWITCLLWPSLYLNIPAHATTGNNKLCTFPIPDSTHEIYKLKYKSLPYQPRVQGLSSQTTLTRRDFESSSDRKILRNFSGRTWIILQFRGRLNMDV